MLQGFPGGFGSKGELAIVSSSAGPKGEGSIFWGFVWGGGVGCLSWGRTRGTTDEGGARENLPLGRGFLSRGHETQGKSQGR